MYVYMTVRQYEEQGYRVGVFFFHPWVAQQGPGWRMRARPTRARPIGTGGPMMAWSVRSRLLQAQGEP